MKKIVLCMLLVSAGCTQSEWDVITGKSDQRYEERWKAKASQLSDGTINIGMSQQELVDLWGNPHGRDMTKTERGTYKAFTYERYCTPIVRYDLPSTWYVFSFHNDSLESWHINQ